MGKKSSKASLILAADIHFNDFPRFPDMFGHQRESFNDIVEIASDRSAPLVLLGDTLDPRHGSISAKVLDPVCDLFQEAGTRFMGYGSTLTVLRGNHGRGSLGTEDHLEAPLGMIGGIQAVAHPVVMSLCGFVGAFVPYTDSRDDFIKSVKYLNKEMESFPNTREPKLLFTHQGYKGAFVGPDEPGYAPGEAQGAWTLPPELFKNFEHIFTGHYHKHQTIYIGDTPVTYVGSPIQHNFGDEGQPRGCVLVEWDGDSLNVTQLRSDPKYPTFRKPKVTLESLPGLLKEDLSNAYLQPVIVDPNVTEQDVQALKAYKVFPSIWEVYVQGTVRGGVTSESSPEENISGYVEDICKNFPSEVQDRLISTGIDLYYKTPKESSSSKPTGNLLPQRLQLKNFRRTREETFDFQETGVTVFLGKTGSGKTTLGLGMVYAIYGEMPGTSESPINNLVGKNCSVRFMFSCDDQVYTIIRNRKDSILKDKLFFFKGEEFPGKDSPDNLTCATNPQTQKAIDNVVGIDLHIFQSIVCIDSLFKLASNDVKDNTKREFLEKAFGLEDWEKPYQETLTALREQREKVIDLEKTLATKEAVQDKILLVLHDFKTKSDDWDRQKRKEISDLRSEISQLDVRVSKLNEKETVDPGEVQLKIQEKKDSLEELSKDGEPERRKYNETRAKITEDIGTVRGRKDRAAHDIETLEREKKSGIPMSKLSAESESQVCPTCNQPISAEHIVACRKTFLDSKEKALAIARKEVNIADNRLRELQRLRSGLDGRLQGIDDNIQARRAIKDEILTLTEKLSSQKDQYTHHKKIVDSLIRQRDTAKKKIVDLKSGDDPFIELTQKAKKDAISIVEEINASKQNLQKAKETIEDLNFWERGYSKQGVRSYLLESYLPKLTENIQRQLNVMSDGSLRVSLSSQKTSKTGENQERFTVSVANVRGGASYEELSRGEKQSIDIATALGVNSYSRLIRRHSVGALFLDDIAELGIDDEKAAALGKLINNFAQDIWVGFVTHKEVLASQFEKTVLVSRDSDDFSKYERRG